MEKEFVPYELAVKLKAIGFNELCFTYYEEDGRLSDTPKESGDDIKYQGDCKFDRHQNEYLSEGESCSAPTFSQAFRWFEEKYDNSVTLKTYQTTKRRYYDWEVNVYGGLCHSKYEAELECIKKLIEIVESKPK